MMIQFKFRYCQARMASYLSGDLSEVARRRVARYIDECELCYREYLRQREFAGQLSSSLPRLGKPGAAKLNQMWTNLQADLAAPAGSNITPREMPAHANLSFGYGLAIVALILALTLPLLFSSHSLAASSTASMKQFINRPQVAMNAGRSFAVTPTPAPQTHSPAQTNPPRSPHSNGGKLGNSGSLAMSHDFGIETPFPNALGKGWGWG